MQPCSSFAASRGLHRASESESRPSRRVLIGGDLSLVGPDDLSELACGLEGVVLRSCETRRAAVQGRLRGGARLLCCL